MVEFDYKKPFVLYRLPGESGFHLDTGLRCDGVNLVGDGIRISPWLGKPVGGPAVQTVSTSPDEYRDAVCQAASNARARNGKTVIVREICGIFDHFEPVGMALRYFGDFPSMFCFLFYHPATGYWMGASPELLLVKSGRTGYTRALAGTRSAAVNGPWDDKNIAEHEMVVDDIINNVKASGQPATCLRGDRETLAYGSIEHLCTPVEIHYEGPGDLPLDTFVGILHPTAAIGGYPRRQALDDIAGLESQPRKFYAGVISAGDTAYVILRCAHFDDRHWCVYTGSGITALSDARDEWNETEAKARPLLKILTSEYQN